MLTIHCNNPDCSNPVAVQGEYCGTCQYKRGEVDRRANSGRREIDYRFPWGLFFWLIAGAALFGWALGRR